jgi:Protein of unknown function (DUF3309)
MSILGLVLVVVLLLILFGGVGGPYLGAPWQNGYGFGHNANGLLGVLVVILLVWLLMGRM